MIHRAAKFALLVAFVVIGLSPVAIEAQQRELKQEGAARQKEARQADRKAEAKKEAARKEADQKESDTKEADKKASEKKEPEKKEAEKKVAVKPAGERTTNQRLSITPEREAAVLTFVKRNHAELAELLAHLKENQPKEYERAIRELFRTSERLTQISDRDRAQYDLEVRLWKTQSRIQLLTARLKMGESEDLRSQLKELLSEQLDNRIALLKHEREKVAGRLAKIDGDLNRLAADREKAIEKQLQSLTSTGKAKKPASKPEARRAAGKKQEKQSSATSSDSGSEK